MTRLSAYKLIAGVLDRLPAGLVDANNILNTVNFLGRSAL